jgi:hypothetical protein
MDILFQRGRNNQAVPACICFQQHKSRSRIGARDYQLIQMALLVLVAEAAVVAARLQMK